MKNIIMAILVIAVVGFVGYFIIKSSPRTADVAKVEDNVTSTTTPQSDGQTSGTPVVEKNKAETIIGKSINERDIMAYETLDYLKANPSVVPANVKVTVIPVLNPDGLYKVVGTAGRFTAGDVSSSQVVQISGRYNANKVDLNRNFDCDWQSSAKWQNTTVSGGSSVFSEPESLAIKNYVETEKPKAVVVLYSAAGGVYASSCGSGIMPETSTITNIYAKASGYPANESFDFYDTTGDMVKWLAKKPIPAISVLLTNHKDTEWTKNQKGIEALLKHYAK